MPEERIPPMGASRLAKVALKASLMLTVPHLIRLAIRRARLLSRLKTAALRP
ncbi:MAG: hypothetical protein BWY91_02902 [bacterium ADurb.BinA028]|nr:MAG: hypothetical protein BWY91_02902 [bacterium ADurb.BinA028]